MDSHSFFLRKAMNNETFDESRSLPSMLARFRRGLLYSLVAAMCNSGSILFVNIFIANLLGRERFGEFAIVQNTLLTLSSVASFANGFTMTKHVAEFRSVDKARTGRIMGLSLSLSLAMGSLCTILLFICSPWVATSVLNNASLSKGLMLAATVVFFNVINYYQTGVLAGLECYLAIAKAGIIAGIAYFILCASLAYIWGRNGALAGLPLSAGLQCLTLRFFLRRECTQVGIIPDYRGLREERNIFLKFSLPAALSGFSTMPALWLANTLLVRQPSGYTQMALYSAANNLRSLGLFLPGILNNVGISLLNNAKGLGNFKRYWRVFWGNLAVTSTIALVAAVAIALLGETLLSLFGRAFKEGYPILMVLMVAMLAEALMLAVYQVIQTQGRIWLSFFIIVLPRDWTIVVLGYMLIPVYGAVGLSFSYAVGCMIALAATGILAGTLRRSFQFPLDSSRIKI
jgi:O-antigen/teichoic acid export membrane protein